MGQNVKSNIKWGKHNPKANITSLNLQDLASLFQNLNIIYDSAHNQPVKADIIYIKSPYPGKYNFYYFKYEKYVEAGRGTKVSMCFV